MSGEPLPVDFPFVGLAQSVMQGSRAGQVT